MKKCSRCGECKPLDQFTKNSRISDGLSIHCTTCKKLFKLEYKKRHPDRVKQSKKNFQDKNPDYMKNYMKEYREGYKPIRNAREAERKRTDPLYKLSCRIRTNIYAYIKRAGVKKKCSSSELLGCTHEEFKKYFESKFTEGMSWELFCNSDSIHIDHIIPVDAFDLSIESELKKCYHYTNLQPLWKLDNLEKSNKIIP